MITLRNWLELTCKSYNNSNKISHQFIHVRQNSQFYSLSPVLRASPLVIGDGYISVSGQWLSKYIKLAVRTKASVLFWLVSGKVFSHGTGQAISVWAFLMLAKVPRLSTNRGLVQQRGVYKLFPIFLKLPCWPLALSADIIVIKWTTPASKTMI